MREIRLSGSEGGGTPVLPTPIYTKAPERKGPAVWLVPTQTHQVLGKRLIPHECRRTTIAPPGSQGKNLHF
jgi:hypothetical protein